jgi:uncharacterized protein
MGTRVATRINSPATALFGATRQAVLGYFFDHPDDRFYQSQVVDGLGVGSGAVQRELARLVAGRILLRTVEGRQVYYQVNKQSPVFDELLGLVRKTMGVAGILRAAFEPAKDAIRVAFIFGSFASRTEAGGSDIDLMVIGDTITRATVSPLLRSAQKALRRELNPVVLRSAEFRAKLSEGHHFVSNVFAAEKVFLIGGLNELQAVGTGAVHQAPPDKPAGDR